MFLIIAITLTAPMVMEHLLAQPPSPFQQTDRITTIPVRRIMDMRTHHVSDSKGNALTGLSKSPTMSISWGIPKFTANDELQVLRALQNRLEFVQKSPQASDNRARALMSVMEAIDALEGTNNVSAPIGESGFIDADTSESSSDSEVPEK